MQAEERDRRIGEHLASAERQLGWAREHLKWGLEESALGYIANAFGELRQAERHVIDKEKAEATQSVIVR